VYSAIVDSARRLDVRTAGEAQMSDVGRRRDDRRDHSLTTAVRRTVGKVFVGGAD